jgi:hypothetical protein
MNTLDCVEKAGFGVYYIDGGKMEREAKFAIADPYDDEDGFYLETSTIEELLTEFENHFG